LQHNQEKPGVFAAYESVGLVIVIHYSCG